MRLLFIHQNLPGQFKHLLSHYVNRPGYQVMGVGERQWVKQNLSALPKGLPVMVYDLPTSSIQPVHPYLQTTNSAVCRGQAVARVLATLKQRGFIPDVIYAHPGWGEALYIKDVFPDAKLINFCEFYYHACGQDVGFDPEYPSSEDDLLQLRTRNAHHLLSLECMDAGISPTKWQRSCFPAVYQHQISVIHDGVDTAVVRPDSSATLTLPSGKTLTAQDQVITFVNRNLEPCRGFHSFMRALPQIQQQLPDASILIVGGDGVSYGKAPQQGGYRAQLLAEVGSRLDYERLHFLGQIPYGQYLQMLRISTAHVYLTYPFVLSWSMLEAMATGCVVIGSSTAPVQEIIEDGRNGILVDFFSSADIANAVVKVCRAGDRMMGLRQAARDTVLEKYDLYSVCLPAQVALIEREIVPASAAMV